MKPQNILIPSKFLSLILNMVTTTMIFFSYPDNIITSYPTLTSKSDPLYTGAKVSVLFCNSITLITLTIELVLHFVGYNLFRHTHNLIVTSLHLLGIILQMTYMYQCWNFPTLWFIFLSINLNTIGMEVITAISSSLKYRKWN